MYLAQHVAAVDRLLDGPAPRCTDLMIGEGFWEDDGTGRLAAEEAFAEDCEALVGVLARRWGAPEEIRLDGHLISVAEGEPVPEPLRTLCGYVEVLHRWRLGERWLGIGVGRQGDDLPLQLVAAVGAAVGEGEPAGGELSRDPPAPRGAAVRTPPPSPPGTSGR